MTKSGSFARFAALSLLAASAASCSDPTPPVTRFRLIDAVIAGTATQDGTRAQATSEEPARALLSGRAGILAKTRGARHEGTFVHTLLRSAGAGVEDDEQSGVLTVCTAHVRAGVAVRIRATLSRDRRPGDLFFALDLNAPVDPATLADPARLQILIQDHRPFLRTILPVDGDREGDGNDGDDGDGDIDDKEIAFETSLPPGRAKELLILIASFDGPDHAAEDALISLRPLTQAELWDLRSERLARNAARVAVGPVTWEAIVLEPGEGLRVPVPAGFHGGNFRCDIAIDSDGPAALIATVHLNDAEMPSGATALRSPRDDRESRRFDLRIPESESIGSLTLRVRAEGPTPQTVGGARALFCRPVLLSKDAVSRPLDERRPDVVLISLDTVRADHLHAYGAEPDTSPNLTRLAPSTARFQDASSAAPWTLPSHVSMLSGLYPDRHGAHGPASRISPRTRLLADLLRAEGYETAAFTGGGYVNAEFGFARGFERYASVDPAWPPRDLIGDPNQAAPNHGAPSQGGAMAAMAHQTSRSRADLLDWIEDEPAAPRFLFVHTYAAHNYAAPADDLRAVGASEDDVAALARAPIDAAAVAKILRDHEGARADIDADIEADIEAETVAIRRRARLAYDATLRIADRLVGDIVTALERAGRLDQTLLIITSDHGEELFERGGIGHGQSLHQEQLHVPLLIRGPGVSAGVYDEVVSLVDLVPTVLDRLGLPATVGDGRSLAPLLRGAGIEPRAVLARGNRRNLVHRAIRGARRKLIAVDQTDGSVQRFLFDLKDDPAETRSLYDEDGDAAQRMEHAMNGLVQALRARAAVDDADSFGSSRWIAPTEGAGLSDDLARELRELGYLGSDS